MLCAISGELPNQPVFSTSTHLIYEKTTIERAIGESGRCPVTGEILTLDSLVPVHQPPALRTKVNSLSTPGIITLLQKEWDDMTLEVFSLRQQLDVTRKELAQSLYQHDAACRVVARLVRERDEALALLRNFSAQAGHAHAHGQGNGSAQGGEMEVDDAPPASAPAPASAPQMEPGISAQLLQQLNDACKALSAGRKHRKASERVLGKEGMGALRELRKVPLLSPPSPSPPSSAPSLSARAVDTSTASLSDEAEAASLAVLAGDSAGRVQLLDMGARKVTASAQAHGNNSPITSVQYLPQSHASAFLSSSSDGTLAAWKLSGGKVLASFRSAPLSVPLVGLAAHPDGSLVLSASEDSSWRIHDLAVGLCLKTVEDAGAVHSAAALHPDGLILGLGARSGSLGIWDIREQQKVATLSEHTAAINSVSFSENGYLCATSSGDGSVKVWDLRKLTCTKTLDVGLSSASSVRFDYSGTYLAVAGTSPSAAGRLSVQLVKGWKECVACDYSSPLTSLAWGAYAQNLVAAAQDGAVLLYGQT